MKKFLLTILVLSAFAAAMAQPVVKPQQYKVLIERSIQKTAGGGCYKWAPPPQNTSNCISNYGCPPKYEDGRQYYQDWCLIEDPTCSSCNNIQPSLSIQVVKGGLPNYTEIPARSLAGLSEGNPQKYFDTLNIFQSQFDITEVLSQLNYGNFYNPNDYCNSENFSVNCYLDTEQTGFPVTGEFYDKTYSTSTPQYYLITRVRIIPNLDPTFTLPSHDQVIMIADALNFSAIWQYYDSVSNAWQDVPAGYASGTNNKTLTISGYNLYGNNYVNYLHSTINFRVRNSTGSIVSVPVNYTMRLSSPHISSVVPTHLNCFERNEGSMKITFDRALLPGERLNILLYDTLHRVDYSALNIDELETDNSYTLKNELRAGKYFVNLLGKYAKGIEYDLIVNNRIDTIRTYIAANSINFEEDFNTPLSDDFNAYTDYTGYSQATYTGAVNHLAFVEITQPASINFAVRVDANVLCKGTASGSVTLAADGGMGNYRYSIKSQNSEYADWIAFDNNTYLFTSFYPNIPFSSTAVRQTISNLKAGIYTIRVRDNVDCYKKDASGNEKIFSFEIKEPEKGLTVDVFELSPITAAGLANGKIKLQVSGGSPFPTAGQEIIYPLPYQVEWRDSTTNQLISSHTTSFVDNKFETILDNLSNGTYIFRAFDRSYNANDPNNAGCYLELIIPVKEPQPLMVSIEQRRQVSCNGSSDGELIAKPSGGIPIDSVHYTFKWYRQTAEGNIQLSTTDSLIENLAAGTYLVEITDKYNNTKLSEPFVLTEPTPLQLEFTTTQASCYSSFTGSMAVSVTGGTPFASPADPYTYEWSNGAKTAIANNVAGGNYLLVVRDSMNCIAKDTVSVTSPVRLIATHTVQNVSCHNTNDGEIAVSITGGNAPYAYVWSNGNNTATASGLTPGTYWYTVFDANGCYDTDTVVLDMPDTLLLDLGPDRVMCIGQTIHLNATASATQTLNYTWTNANGIFATTSKVAIKQPGTYDVAVSNSRGCILRDTIQVTTIDSIINTDFVVSTQAYAGETVHLVNISQPKTDSVKWIVPSLGNTIRVLQQNNSKSELIFADTGRYEITMRAYYRSGCIEDSSKTINVISRGGNVLGSQSNAFLRVYAVIFPNPNDGTFKVQLEFSETTSARLRLINTLNNVLVDDRQAQGSNSYLLDYNLSNVLTSGTYILVIDAAKGSFVYKVVIVQ